MNRKNPPPTIPYELFYRMLWYVVYKFLFVPTPPQFHVWRVLLLRLFRAKVAWSCHVYPSVQIWAPWNLCMGPDSCLGRRVNCYCVDRVIIGTMSVVSQGVHICTAGHDYTVREFPIVSLPITIGDKAWICSEAFLSPGVRIGNGTVIGARSVVTKDQPDMCVCAGNPCKAIKPREFEY